jgi:phosphoglycerate dehydrogenase-like enzyme
MAGPAVVALMSRDTWNEQFDSARRERLGRAAAPTDPEWISRFEDPAAHGALADAEVLITSWGASRLTAERLALMPKLRAVLHCAGSVRPLVTDEFWSRGIVLSSAADANADPVAEYTYAAVVMAGKKAPFLAGEGRVRRSDWNETLRWGPLSTVGLTVGIIGFSRIGRRVVDRLVGRLEGVRCLVTDPYADPEAVAAAGAELVSLDEMLSGVDILSIHAPELPETRHMIGAEQLAALADHTTVINTARGSLIDTAALEAECRSGRLNAILDVTDPEPLHSDSVMYDLPNVMITPHVAGSLGTERLRMSDLALDELDRLIAGEELEHRIREEDMAHVA